MYLTSQDDELRAKRAAVLRLYYEPPPDEHIVCVDDKSGMQALERRYPDIAMRPGQPVRREFEYIRHGTLCWMGALDVRRGLPFGLASCEHNGDTFVDLLELIELVYPDGRGHIVMDNLSAHEHPRRQRLVRRASALDSALHPQARLLAQPGRVLAQSSDVESSREARLPPPANSPIKSTITSSGTYKPTNPSTGLTALSLGALLAALQAGGTSAPPMRCDQAFGGDS